MGIDDDDGVEEFLTRPVRPIVQIAARAGLWGAVALGAVGGCVGALRSGSQPTPIVEAAADDYASVPAPVAGFAETLVEDWLAPTDENRDALADRFVDDVALVDFAGDKLVVRRVATVTGARLAEGYWTVTVAADVEETLEDGTTQAGVWYVQLGIVGSVDQGLAALATPAIVPPPAEVETTWSADHPSLAPPSGENLVADTVTDFLSALLAGVGDPSPYVAPGVVVTPADPPPFKEVVVDRLAVERLPSGELEGGIRIWVQVKATTAAGTSQVLGYELVAVERVDRWEIVTYSGFQTVDGPDGRRTPVIPGTADDDDADDGDREDRDGSATTSTTATSAPATTATTLPPDDFSPD